MPELPEVETIRRQLGPLVEGRRLLGIEILDPRWTRPLAPDELAAALLGRRIESLGRRGKYLTWGFEGDVHLIQHLRMTGTVLSEPPADQRHVRVRMTLGAAAATTGSSRDQPIGARTESGRDRPAAASTGSAPDGRRGSAANARRTSRAGRERRLRLAVVDPRRFGTGQLFLGSQALADFFDARLGLEPLDEEFSAEHLRELARGRSASIKALLLDQRRIAGVGNIYANEALFRAGIHPLRPAGRLSSGQRSRLHDAVIEALRAGIDAKGASIDDFRHLDGAPGSFQEEFLVHARAGEPCERCGTTIVRMLVAGRASYVCERCQPRPRPRRPRGT